MSDIVERLKSWCNGEFGRSMPLILVDVTAEITRLRAELAEANAIADLVRQERDVLLKPVMDMTEADSVDDDAQNLMIAYYWLQQCNVARAELAEARKALQLIRSAAEQSSEWPPRRRSASLDGIEKVAIRALKPKPPIL